MLQKWVCDERVRLDRATMLYGLRSPSIFADSIKPCYPFDFSSINRYKPKKLTAFVGDKQPRSKDFNGYDSMATSSSNTLKVECRGRGACGRRLCFETKLDVIQFPSTLHGFVAKMFLMSRKNEFLKAQW